MTRRFILDRIVALGLNVDVVVAPERTVEGVALSELGSLPQIIGGEQVASLRVKKLFEETGVETSILGSLEAAEFAKLMSNSFRDLLFSASNEYAMFADHLNLDFNEILEKSKYGYPRLAALANPGPVAGPCLTKDPKIFSHSAQNIGFKMNLTEASRIQNEHLASHILANILGKTRNKKVGILGLAFKGNPETDDTRDSFVNLLLKEFSIHSGTCDVYLWDPIDSRIDERYLFGADYAELEDIIDKCDLILIQNSNKYFASLDFFEKLNQRKSSSKLTVYQLWDIVLRSESHKFDLKTFGSPTPRVNNE